MTKYYHCDICSNKELFENKMAKLKMNDDEGIMTLDLCQSCSRILRDFIRTKQK
jgi:uncharacterized Zn finger protein